MCQLKSLCHELESAQQQTANNILVHLNSKVGTKYLAIVYWGTRWNVPVRSAGPDSTISVKKSLVLPSGFISFVIWFWDQCWTPHSVNTDMTLMKSGGFHSSLQIISDLWKQGDCLQKVGIIDELICLSIHHLKLSFICLVICLV